MNKSKLCKSWRWHQKTGVLICCVMWKNSIMVLFLMMDCVCWGCSKSQRAVVKTKWDLLFQQAPVMSLQNLVIHLVLFFFLLLRVRHNFFLQFWLHLCWDSHLIWEQADRSNIYIFKGVLDVYGTAFSSWDILYSFFSFLPLSCATIAITPPLAHGEDLLLFSHIGSFGHSAGFFYSGGGLAREIP